MQRRVYIEDELLRIAEYKDADKRADFDDWGDSDTELAYNQRRKDTFEEFIRHEWKQRLYGAILRKDSGETVGILMLSPEHVEPDLAIRIFRPYRGKGYGTAAFRLGVRYAFETLGLDELHAGCYPHNTASLRMVSRCGFVPNPRGDVREKHLLTGEEVVQMDFILRKRVIPEATR